MPFATDDAAVVLAGLATHVSPKYGTAISVLDAHPGSKDAPDSFYLQDAKGRRAGWINGRPVAQIPDASVGQDPPAGPIPR